ncbi:LysM peptidoglycan-binding domain-containing protein [Nocardia arthritidis]|uniref:LysM peptidoglycan-binding domain-containing protein n=1 Tax=Nocardia arthritidis TaxID=228602 RepID=A0A6G9YH65_9NOCA|nr:LysM peptidoglycan-binding domain-containing protein [Nocardia arthritidis]QIS12490.1 LysM peptidoglycan-binding domain-containing protein [Nocardia arthritidis]
MSDTLQIGDELGLGQSLQNGAYSLTLQNDGNLVLTEPGNEVWASGTHGRDVQRAVMQDDGNFVLYKADGSAAWSTETNGKGADRLTLQSDRNVVLYAGDKAVWSTKTATDKPMPESRADAAPAAQPHTYTVESGDTLESIAERELGDRARFMDIVRANGISDPDMINVGQVLTIP